MMCKLTSRNAPGGCQDFNWMAQLRYYWAPTGSIIMYDTQKPSTKDQVQVSIINSTLLYGFEYLGSLYLSSKPTC